MPTQRQEISASIQANFPDNVTQFITPTRLRTEQGLFENYVVLNEQTASIIAQAVVSASVGSGSVSIIAFNAYTSSTNTFTGSIQTQVNALQAATGSYITNAQTSSMSVLSASFASSSVSASYASSSTSASYASSSTSASYASASTSASFALTASFALNAGGTINTGSFATTGSNTFNGTNTFTGSLNAQSASITFLTVGTIVSSSTIFSSGSNTLGDASNDVQTLWGTVNLPTGPLQVTGSVSSTGGFTGSLQGTSSFANSATSASYALTASFASTASNADLLDGKDSSIFATTGSNTFKGDQTISSSLIVTNTIKGTGSINLQPNNSDPRYLEIYNTSPTDTHITASGGQLFIGDDQTYVKVDNYGSVDRIDIVAGNLINVSSSVQFTGSVSSANGFTGSLQGTASIATTALAVSTSISTQNLNHDVLFVDATGSGSIQVDGGLRYNPNTNLLTTTASFANNATSASYALNSTSASFALTASFALSGGGGSTNTGSLLTTASVSLNTITFTKGDGSTFPITVNTGSATTIDTGSLTTTASFNAYTASTNTFTGSIQTQVNTLQSVTSSYVNNSQTSSMLAPYVQNSQTSSFVQNSQTSSFVTNAQTGSFVTSAITGSSIITASVSLNTITFTEGDGTTFNITVDTGSGGGGGMNLGANTFTGSQTIQSQSLLLQASSSTALNTNFFTASTAGANFGANVLMFAGSAQSGSVILSGSRNIGTLNPITNVQSLTSRGGGNLNGNIGIFNTSYTTASSPIVLTNNFLGGAAQNAIPNTSSVTTLTSNFVGGTVITTGSALSNVSITSNNIDAAIITNDFTGSGATQQVSVTSNIIKGGTSQANFAQIKFASTSSNTNSRTFVNNIMFGPANIASLEASGAVSATSHLLNTAIIGSNLIVSGTMANTSISASMFVGQFNETGSLADPSQIKFAVGTGTTNAARRTSFYVSQSGETIATNLVPTVLNNQTTTTIESTGSITQRIHPKQTGSTTLAGKVSSSFVISPEIQIEPTSANYKVILERDMIATVGQSGSYMGTFDVTNNVLIATSTDCYGAILKLNVLCVPGKPATASSITASITALLQNDAGMTPAISSSYNGTLFQVWAKHQGGASASLAYVGQEFYHSGSTQS